MMLAGWNMLVVETPTTATVRGLNALARSFSCNSLSLFSRPSIRADAPESLRTRLCCLAFPNMLYIKNRNGDGTNGDLMNLATIFGLGPLELLIIIAVIVILFLPALIPKFAKRLGETFSMVKHMANKSVDEE